MRYIAALILSTILIGVGIAIAVGSISLDIGQTRPQRVQVIDNTPQTLAQIQPMVSQIIETSERANNQAQTMFIITVAALLIAGALAVAAYAIHRRTHQQTPIILGGDMLWINTPNGPMAIPRLTGENRRAWEQRAASIGWLLPSPHDADIITIEPTRNGSH